MKRVICTILLVLFVFAVQAQIGSFKLVVSDTVKSKDYRFIQLPNYSVYNAFQNITSGDENLATPPGTTAQRPIVPSGKIVLRFNTDSNALEYGNSAGVWKILGTSTTQTIDTSSIANFGLKTKAMFSGTSPILYNGVTGNISIQQSNSSQGGYLSQADWIVFNSKLSDPGSNGILVRTAPGTLASRQLVAASTNISLVNPNGVSGNPSIDINDTLLLRQLQLPYIPAAAPYADSVLFLNRSTGFLEVRPVLAGGGGSTAYGTNGLSKTVDSIQLGQAIGAVGNPANLSSEREIPLNGFRIGLSGTGSFGIGTATPSYSYKMTVQASGSTGGINVSAATATGINVSSTNTGIVAFSNTGTAVIGTSSGGAGTYAVVGGGGIGGAGGKFSTTVSGGDANTTILELERNTTGPGSSNGAGFNILFKNPLSIGTTSESGRITNYFSNFNSGVQSSAFGFHLVNNAVSARKALLASTGQWTWDGYGTTTFQTVDTSYNTLVVDGSGNIFKRAGSNTTSNPNLDQVLALGGRLSANKSVSMGHKRWDLDSAALRLRAVDSPAISIDLAKAGVLLQFNKPEGVARTYPGSTPFKFIMENVTDDVPTERNNPVKWGPNINRADSNNAPGVWYSMEPNYRPGGARWIENHLEVSLPNGTLHNSRLFSSTFKRGVGDSIESSENQWDFRGTQWNFMNLTSTVGYVGMGVGSLNVNNTTAGPTDFSITNGSDESHFSIAPGTSTLTYSGPLFQMQGNLNTSVINNNSTERAGIRFIGDGGVTGYIIKYNSAWGAQPDLANAMVFTAANSNQLETSLALKNNGTAWLGDITAYTTGSQKVNISGTLAARGIGKATTAPEILVRTSDSTIRAMDTADLRTVMGIGSGGGQSEMSITGDGTSGNKFKLTNDNATPGINKIYGTNYSGTKGFVAPDVAWYNLIKGGADNTGATDCSDIIRNAQSAGYKTIYLPEGTFTIASTVQLKDSVVIRGAGRGRTIIKVPASTEAFKASFALGGNLAQLQDFTFKGTLGGSGQQGIVIDSAFGIIINNLGSDSVGGFVIDVKNNGLLVDAGYTFGNQITNCFFRKGSGGVKFGIRAEYNILSSTTIVNTTYGIYNNGGNNRIIGCNSSENSYGIYVDAGANDAHEPVIGCTFNHSGTDNVYVTGILNGIDFIGCEIFVGNIAILNSDGVSFNGGTIAVTSTTCTNSPNTTFNGVRILSGFPTFTGNRPEVIQSVGGNTRLNSLDTDNTPPSTSGTTKMVITDANGQLSFDNIPAGATTLYTGDGILPSDRNVGSGGFTLRVTGNNASDTIMTVVNSGTSGIGSYIYGDLRALDVQSPNLGMTVYGGTQGMQTKSGTNEALFAQSDGMRAAKFVTNLSGTNTTDEILNIQRAVASGVGANGIGAAITLSAENTSGSQVTTAQWIGKLTTATAGAEVSEISMVGVNNSSTGTVLKIGGDGALTTFGKRIVSVVTSAAGTLTIGNAEAYIFNGTTTTWTLPAISGTTGYKYIIKNIGSGAITLNSSGGGNDIYDTVAVNTLSIASNSSVTLISNGTYFTVIH